MKRTILSLFSVLGLVLPLAPLLDDLSAQEKSEAKFPELKSEDLNGKAVTLPKDFPGNPTLILMAFESKQQDDVDQWIEKLELKAKDDIPWMELAVIGSKYKLMKAVIDGGMRKGVTEEKDRARVVTIYSSRNDLMKKIGLKEVSHIYALVIDQDGTIRKVVEGLPTDEKMAEVKGFFGKK